MEEGSPKAQGKPPSHKRNLKSSGRWKQAKMREEAKAKEKQAEEGPDEHEESPRLREDVTIRGGETGNRRSQREFNLNYSPGYPYDVCDSPTPSSWNAGDYGCTPDTQSHHRGPRQYPGA